ncbi:PREDICTED: presenilins-associated rhomboid-like protein, mitochondrial [Rhagoletis zephyria]|uniref:presenilins-associated rhomboid-like protein, mitochondrial n=1 Tax=Rhagoletis zephyria TaxID=28612 RepID=UPI0008118B1B|nr:PREDICTED: presenilins-associated rhomboid-like protein, mitochondrial [Rhagoletis zephyria]
MLLHRAFCRNWTRQLVDPLLPSHSCKYARPRAILLRSMRSSAKHQRPARSGSLQTSPPFENYTFGGAIPPSNVVKALIFTGAFSVGCFMSVTILEYENARNMMLEKARQSKFPWLRRQTVNQEQSTWQDIKQEVQQFWDKLTPGERVFVPLCALNILVFKMWRVPALRNTMMTYFCSSPAGRAVCWPMFLSTFSHYSLFHLFANMYVLHSFSNAAVLTLGKEQFLGVYLSAGVIASFASILYKTITAQAGLSIGASGAIMAILSYVCAKYPDTQLSILFLPMLHFSAGAAIKVIMGFDLAGCILGWKFFDHAAHLGGALFGLFWVYFGTELWQKRIPFLTLYHDLRKTK